MNNSALANIDAVIRTLWVNVETIKHPTVLTCEDADAHTPYPEFWLKSLLLKSRKHGVFCYVLNGRDRADLDLLKSTLDDKRISFVPPQESEEIVGCESWAIPPFWHMNRVPIFINKILLKNPRVYFNPGVNTLTYGISGTDFQKIWEYSWFRWI